MCLLHRTCLGRDQLQSTSREEIATFGTVLELSSPSTMSSAYHASPSAPGTVTIQRAIRHAAHDNTQLYLSCLLPELRAHIDLLCAGVAPREQARSIPYRCASCGLFLRLQAMLCRTRERGARSSRPSFGRGTERVRAPFSARRSVFVYMRQGDSVEASHGGGEAATGGVPC